MPLTLSALHRPIQRSLIEELQHLIHESFPLCHGGISDGIAGAAVNERSRAQRCQGISNPLSYRKPRDSAGSQRQADVEGVLDDPELMEKRLAKAVEKVLEKYPLTSGEG